VKDFTNDNKFKDNMAKVQMEGFKPEHLEYDKTTIN